MFTEGLHNSALQWVREVMLDTVGAELQVVNHTEKTLQLQEDGKVILTPVHGQDASSEILPINFSRLSKAVKKGDTIFVGHYLFTGSETTSVWLEVDEVKEEDVICVIKNTATLTGSLFTLHASQVHIDLPTLSDKDKEVFLFQKAAVYKCNMAGKPAVVTRVVDSMTGNLRPTRTESTDVANAVLDGSDGILLGAETLRGLYPIETISIVGKICAERCVLGLSRKGIYFLYLRRDPMWGDVRQIDVNLSGISMHNDQEKDCDEEVGVHTEYIRFGLIGNITLFVLFRYQFFSTKYRSLAKGFRTLLLLKLKGVLHPLVLS